MERWIKLYPKILYWEWYNNTNVKVLFFHCLLKANFQERKWNGFIIERGQFVTSIATLSKELGLTPMQIRAAMQKLQKSEEITIRTTNRFTIITICKYASYQDTLNEQEQTNEQSDNKQITNKQQTNNNNNRIIDNIDSIDSIENKENTTTKVDSVKKRNKFIPPSLTEVSAYCQKRNNGINPENFINYYQTNGWVQSKGKPIVDWQAAIRWWETNPINNSTKNNNNGVQRTKRNEAPVSDWDNVSQSELNF